MKALAFPAKFGVAALATVLMGPLVAGRKADVDAVEAFDRLKALEGTWEAAPVNGAKATTSFELTAGGTVLIERYSNPALPGGGTC